MEFPAVSERCVLPESLILASCLGVFPPRPKFYSAPDVAEVFLFHISLFYFFVGFLTFEHASLNVYRNTNKKKSFSYW